MLRVNHNDFDMYIFKQILFYGTSDLYSQIWAKKIVRERRVDQETYRDNFGLIFKNVMKFC